MQTLEPSEIRDFVVTACERHLIEGPDVTIDMVRQLLGADSRTRRRFVTRHNVRALLRAELGRKRGNRAPPLTDRSIEIIERDKIAPAVFAAIESELAGAARANTLCEWSDYRVRLSARPCDSLPDTITLSVTAEYICQPEDVLIAITDDEVFADSLCTDYPQLTDAFVPSTGLSGLPRLYLGQIGESIGYRQCELVEVKDGDTADKLGVTDLIRRGVALYLYRTSEERTTQTKLRYRITSEQDIHLNEGYCYWSAARVLRLRSAIFDFTAFPNSRNFTFALKQRLGRHVPVFTESGSRIIEVCTDMRLTPGNSLEITWRSIA